MRHVATKSNNDAVRTFYPIHACFHEVYWSPGVAHARPPCRIRRQSRAHLLTGTTERFSHMPIAWKVPSISVRGAHPTRTMWEFVSLASFDNSATRATSDRTRLSFTNATAARFRPSGTERSANFHGPDEPCRDAHGRVGFVGGTAAATVCPPARRRLVDALPIATAGDPRCNAWSSTLYMSGSKIAQLGARLFHQ